MNLLDFPSDIFLLIVALLTPTDLICIRRVSKSFHATFTDPNLSYQILIQHYPKSREARLASEGSKEADWGNTFQRVATRYHNLSLATPASVKRFAIAKSFVIPEWAKFYPISPWRRHLHFEERFTPFHYPDTLWTYDEGLLIFPSTQLRQYAVFDLEARRIVEIEINPQNKIVRRIRLKSSILVVEWCEQQSFHQLNESETVYRHFATAFNIVRAPPSGIWTAVFRNEWKIHFLGMALNSRDRFFSTHNDSHYALYLWQPNRSAWGEDEPIESLVIWDISSPSSYRPSQDPTGKDKPEEGKSGPKVIKRLSFTDLDFYNIRQRATPVLQGLELDEQHVYIIEENHRWMSGDQATFTLPRLHEVKSIGISFHAGPRWESCCNIDGDSGMSFCQKSSTIRQPNLAPCWRHEEFPYLTVAEVNDVDAGVILSARQCFTFSSLNIKAEYQTSGSSFDVSLRDEFWQQLLNKGKICGDERWLIGENSQSEVVILFFDEGSIEP